MDPEEIEKVRQEIMRFRELLNIMRQRLENGERAYSQLFSNFSVEEMQGVKEKDLQWKLAEEIIDDLSPLRKAVMTARFDARELEKAFEELYDIIVAAQEP
jgi:hypothetical protein